MKCPNCQHPKLRTTETFQTPEQTVRTKKCPSCKWTFTSRESISDELAIPRALRRAKVKK